jgi:hypothetical protein
MGFNAQACNDTGRQQALASLLPVVDSALEFVWAQIKHGKNPAAKSSFQVQE